mgnify:CR=1 FL=1
MGLFGKKKQKEEPVEASDDEKSVVQEEAPPLRTESPKEELVDNDDDDYADFASQHTERLMGPEEEHRSFGLNLTAKFLFLVGTVLYLIMAVEDFQWAQQLSRDRSNAAASSAANNAVKDDDFSLEDFVTSLNGNSSNSNTLKVNVTTTGSIPEKNGPGRRYLQTNWYSTHYWNQLPDVIRGQAELLGYEQNTWDNALPVYTDEMFWDELTPAQQAAATNVFGYTEESWNDYVSRFMETVEETTSAPVASPTEEEEEEEEPSTGPVEEEEEEEEMDDFFQKEEEEEEEEEEKEEEVAEETTEEDTEEEESTTNAFYMDILWEDLPMDIQVAATTLGYDADTWNNDTWVATSDKFWVELTQEEQESATVLGYDQETWDGRDGALEEDGLGEEEEEEEEDGTEDAPPRDGSASMFISTTGGYARADGAHGRTYQILYCIAAACFIIVGILDSQRERLGYHTIMVLAGIFGLLSGGLIRENEFVSSVCHSLSVHFFLIQALLVIYNRLPVTWDPVIRKVLWIADSLFVASALLNIVLSYMYYSNDDDDMTVGMATSAIMAAIFWCHTGIIYMVVTILFWKKNREQNKRKGDEMEENSVQNSCSVVPNDDGEMDVVFDDSPKGTV